jgi:hypothetical protein
MADIGLSAFSVFFILNPAVGFAAGDEAAAFFWV